ncbi:hypothetical protein RMSM_06567 [Rhodopirellula maiorica SM1]|uniref:Uncharacterized protein n=1 Tax=Rhodopirellula maiorica SM1 TaxID=1265738 RepID=M5RAJ0_9BACT|nr:hypothetical protein RMSM_06567 [Rhodopirellula maiorica SM1]
MSPSDPIQLLSRYAFAALAPQMQLHGCPTGSRLDRKRPPSDASVNQSRAMEGRRMSEPNEQTG